MFVSVGVQVRWTVCDAHGCISVVWMNPWYSSEDLVVQRSKVANLYVKASQWYVSLLWRLHHAVGCAQRAVATRAAKLGLR